MIYAYASAQTNVGVVVVVVVVVLNARTNEIYDTRTLGARVHSRLHSVVAPHTHASTANTITRFNAMKYDYYDVWSRV